MLLEKLTIENLGVFGGKKEFDLSVDPSKPIILCGGYNGSGKTTIFESVLLCLYGKKHHGVPDKKYHNIISRMFHDSDGEQSDAMSVSLQFQHAQFGNTTKYAVKRSWERGGDGRPIESLEIHIKGKGDASTHTSNDQSIIDGILPLGIARLFFFDGEKIQQMAEAGDERSYIKTSLDSLFGLDVARQLYNDIGIHMSRNSDSEIGMIMRDIERENCKKMELEENLDRAREDQSFKDSELDMIRDELSSLEGQFTQLGGRFAEKRTQLMEEKAALESKIDRTKKGITDMCSGLLPLCMIRDQMASVRSGLDSDAKVAHGISEHRILSDAFADVKKRVKSELGASTATKQIEAILSERLDEIPSRRDTVFGFSFNDTRDLQELINSANTFDLEPLNKLCSDLVVMEKNLKKIDTSIDLAPKQDEIGPLFSKILHVGKDLKDTEDEIENLKNMESQYRSELVLTNSNIRKLLGKKRQCIKKSGGLNLAPKIQEALQDFSDALRAEKSKTLASHILDTIRTLLHKEDFIGDVRVNPDTFEVSLYQKNGDEIAKDKLSKGELQIYTTSVMWGIAKTSGRAMPFIIDTPLARLDTSHKSNMTEGFYPHASHQMVILSTDSEITKEYYADMQKHITRSMVVRHENGRSKISNGYFWTVS